ncbi:hypothetical protein [uncultured Oscillibacter sp.]|uniref:hypothetical protein n=1 Tax=uncultured Oscillibacter sp. TaxID=876091 RepID=UPI00260A1CC5|nr:hypothetical protein [uncultured Oscillibacter sp.]
MGISPLYSIHQYSEEIYKVVAFKGVRDPENPRVRDKEHEQHYDAKLNEAFCRATGCHNRNCIFFMSTPSLVLKWYHVLIGGVNS